MTDTHSKKLKKVTDIKVGDVFVELVGLETSGLGVVSRVSKYSFDIRFDGDDERGPFYREEIGSIIRKATKLDKILK